MSAQKILSAAARYVTAHESRDANLPLHEQELRAALGYSEPPPALEPLPKLTPVEVNEREFLVRELNRSPNVEATATRLGLGRQTLYYKMRQYFITRADVPWLKSVAAMLAMVCIVGCASKPTAISHQPKADSRQLPPNPHSTQAAKEDAWFTGSVTSPPPPASNVRTVIWDTVLSCQPIVRGSTYTLYNSLLQGSTDLQVWYPIVQVNYPPVLLTNRPDKEFYRVKMVQFASFGDYLTPHYFTP